MNKLKNAVFSILNVLIIVGILLFILVGLIKIGVFEAPSFLKKLLNSDDGNNDTSPEINSGYTYEYSDNDYTIQSAVLDSDSVREMLETLQPADSYFQDVTYTIISDKSTATKHALIMKKAGVYCAFYISENGTIEKQLIRQDDTTTINTLVGDNLHSVTYNNGDIDFDSQTGIIMTHRDFFQAVEDPAYTFSVMSGDYGTALFIEFTTTIGAYSQLQQYKLSLDYGIVTQANCFENGRLIYTLNANAVASEILTEINIPAKYMEALPSAFDEYKSSKSE